jgi:hypothetical protein
MRTSSLRRLAGIRHQLEAKESFSSKIARLVKEGEIRADDVGRASDGSTVLRLGFFYSHGKDAGDFAKSVVADLTKLGIAHKLVDKGEENRPFRGGAKVKDSTHWWVKIKEA